MGLFLLAVVCVGLMGHRPDVPMSSISYSLARAFCFDSLIHLLTDWRVQ